jgi:hypothetical protein
MTTAAKANLLPDDILTAILELARQEVSEDRLVFRGHDEDLQRIFYDLSKDPSHSLLHYFVFSNAGPREYSPALSDSVSKLQLAGLLGRQNPDYEVLFTTPSSARFYDEVLSPRLTSDEVGQLREIAKKFVSMVEKAPTV